MFVESKMYKPIGVAKSNQLPQYHFIISFLEDSVNVKTIII